MDSDGDGSEEEHEHHGSGGTEIIFALSAATA